MKSILIVGLFAAGRYLRLVPLKFTPITRTMALLGAAALIWLAAPGATMAFTTNGLTLYTDGSASDTQAAAAQVNNWGSNGWTIIVGTNGGLYNWGTGGLLQGFTNTVTIEGASPINPPTIFEGASTVGSGFVFAGASNHCVTIANLILQTTNGSPSAQMMGIYGEGCCFRVTGCTFLNSSSAGECIGISGAGGSPSVDVALGPYGCIDHCKFLMPQNISYNCISVLCNGDYYNVGWLVPMSWGTTNAVCVENCVFSQPNMRNTSSGTAALESQAGARWVFRYNLCTNFTISWHGANSGSKESTLQTEVYENTFMFNDTLTTASYAVLARGGSSVIWSNTWTQTLAGELGTVAQFWDECASTTLDGPSVCYPGANLPAWKVECCTNQLIYPTDYPSWQQIGQGSPHGFGTQTNWPVYIWGNTVPSTPYPSWALGRDGGDGPFIQQGKDIFTNTVMPGYTPLAYPHPFAPPILLTPTNIVSWWPGDGNTLDIINGNNGTGVGGVAYTAGEVNNSFSLNGTSNYVSVAASSTLNVGSYGSGLTIEGWVAPGSITMTYSAPIFEWDSGSAIGVQFWAADYLFASVTDTAGNNHVIMSSNGVLSQGTLQHVALTYDKNSGVAVLYCNGTAVETQNLGSFTPQTSYAANIGRRTGAVTGSGYNWDGLIDELSLYSRALTATEIQAIHSAGVRGKSPYGFSIPPCLEVPMNIVSWWPADSNTLDIINGNNGTSVGGVAYAAGEVNNSFSLNGTSNYVSVAASSTLDVGSYGSGLSIEGWVAPDSITMTYSAPIFEWDSGSSIGVQFWAADYLWASLTDTSGNAHVIMSSSGVLSQGVLQHVALTYDHSSGVAVLYCNGTAVATQNLGSFTLQTSYAANIGRRTGAVIGSGYNWDGLIDELSLYSRALTATEIQAIHNAGANGKCH